MKIGILKTLSAAGVALVLMAGPIWAREPKTGEAQESQNKGCSKATLEGSFGYTSTGYVFPGYGAPVGDFAEVARQSFDGNGNTQATANLSAAGNIVTGVIIQGTYTVDPDCTGTMTLNVVSPFTAQVDLDFVIDDNGKEVRAIVTDADLVESRVYKKQFPQGDNRQ